MTALSAAIKASVNQRRRQGVDTMKKEDIWMMILVVFSVAFTASFGWGVWG